MAGNLGKADDSNTRGIEAKLDTRLPHGRASHANPLDARHELLEFPKQGGGMLVAGGFSGGYHHQRG
jgi:hypothetical protein